MDPITKEDLIKLQTSIDIDCDDELVTILEGIIDKLARFHFGEPMVDLMAGD